MKESFTASLWIPSTHLQSPVTAAAHHYEGDRWTVDRAVACDPSASTRKVLSMLDLELRERLVAPKIPGSGWVLQVDLHRQQHDAVGRLETRTIQFAPSSIACSWLDHPVEIVAPLPPVTKKGKKSGGEGKTSERWLDEIRLACAGLEASWAVLSEGRRGPTLPELLLESRPNYVDLSAVFFSKNDFDEQVIRGIPEPAQVVEWQSGWLVKAGSSPGAERGPATLHEREIWRMLSGWGKRKMHTRAFTKVRDV